MLFNVEYDTGDRLVGYVVPDGYSDTPRLHVRSDGKIVAEVDAVEVKGALVAAGRHENGRCGFVIDESRVAGLAGLDDLELIEASTRLLIYRRLRPTDLAHKVLRLETHLYPLWWFDEALRNRFQYFLRGGELLGRETVTQLFLLTNVSSFYMSGRIYYKNYSYYIEESDLLYAFLHDPYEEMAERLAFLARIGASSSRVLGERDAMIFKPVIELAAALPRGDEKTIKRLLRSMSKEASAKLANPLTRLLTSSTPDEMPGGAAVAGALDILSSFRFIGLRSDGAAAAAAFGEVLCVEPPSLPSPIPGASELAKILRESGVVDALLEKDREVYFHVAEASRKAHKAVGIAEERIRT